jgi:hypothetical protein
MAIAGAAYLLFSGASGLGGFGIGESGALRDLTPSWLWRGGIFGLGVVGYSLAIRASVRSMESLIGGSGADRVKRAQRVSLTTYLTGALVSVAIGVFNPQGFVIVLVFAGAASWGGTAASSQTPLEIARNWKWIATGMGIALVYGIVLGPSIKR